MNIGLVGSDGEFGQIEKGTQTYSKTHLSTKTSGQNICNIKRRPCSSKYKGFEKQKQRFNPKNQDKKIWLRKSQ